MVAWLWRFRWNSTCDFSRILSLAISLVIHLSLGLIPRGREIPSRPQTASRPPAYIEIKDPPVLEASVNQARPKALVRADEGLSSGRVRTRASSRPLRLAKSHWDFSEAVESTAESDVPKAADRSDVPWGEGGGDFGRVRDYLLMERVESETRGLLGYPAVLAEREIGGVVNARLVVDGKGSCDWQKTRISSVRPELRVYVLALLKKLCGLRFWSQMHLERTLTNVDMSFNFDTFAKDERPPRVLGNVILFDIPGKQDTATWRLGPLQGSFFFPIAVLLNPSWITENWDQLVAKKDPLEEFREN